jgi:K(+)-stimulated pyrophosphate-energized sodium pump
MGADLFGSYVATVLAAMVLGIMLSKIWKYSRCFGGIGPILLPMAIAVLEYFFLSSEQC